jgi:hypothetical protein
MFERVGRSTSVDAYTKPQTTRWLSWLSRQMTAHSLTVYYIEQMQPD